MSALRPLSAGLLAGVLAGLLLTRVGGSDPALAQGSRLTGPPVVALEENRREARALAEMVDIPRQALALLQTIRQDLIKAAMRQSEHDAEAASRIIDEVMMPEFSVRATELTNLLIEPWAANFTFSDLRGLRNFYASPLGQKLLRTQPVVQQQGTDAGFAWGQKVFQESVDRHADELRARGLKF